jgi:hypothetical protein
MKSNRKFVSLGCKKKVFFFACFAAKGNSKNLQQKRTGNKRNEAIEAKRKRTEKWLNQENAEGRFYTCNSTDVSKYWRI